jgi:hypothetical protein
MGFTTFFQERMDYSWASMLSADYFASLAYAMEAKLGGFFYLIFFGTPWLLAVFKTEDWSMSTIIIMWTIALYGYLMPGVLASQYMSHAMALGFMVMLFRTMSVLK